MKRDLSHLTKRHIAGIRKWLKSDEPLLTCPFAKVHPQQPCSACLDIFPGIEHFFACPCGQYTLAYVRRVAKQVLKEVNRTTLLYKVQIKYK